MDSQSSNPRIEFVIDKQQSAVVKKAEERITYLFNCKVEFKNVAGSPKHTQWICVTGLESNKAKEYILALTSPTETICAKNIWNHPLFNSEIEDEIETMSCAALSKCEDGDLMISGTQLSVTLAQSIIEVVFSKTSADFTDKEKKWENSRNTDSGLDMSYADHDFSVKENDRDELRGSASLNKNNSSLASVVPQPSSTSSVATAYYTDGFLTSDLSLNTQRTVRTGTEHPATERKCFPEEMISNSMYASASAIYPRTQSTQMCMPHLYSSGGITPPKGAFHTVNHSGDGSVSTVCTYFPSDSHHSGLNSKVPVEACCLDTSRKDSTYLSPQAKMQQAYLRNLGQSLFYSNEDIEKGLASYNMDDIVIPSEYLSTLNRIKGQRHGEGHQSVGTDYREVSNKAQVTAAPLTSSTVPQAALPDISMQEYSDMDASVICVGSVRGDDSTIVLSSEDELDEEFEVVPYPLPPTHYPAPAPSELHSTVRREPTVCMNREVTMNRNSTIMPEDCAVSQQPTAHSILRYIIIDGSNVAMAHGNNKVFSVEGLRICINYFVMRGHDRITAFVPEWRRYSENQTSITGRALLEKLHNDGFIKFTPARRINGKVIASYDDRFILNLAEKEDGVIVSNDQFRDLCKERDSYQNIVANRLLQFMFVRDHFMPPDDPLGRHGPHLDDFLRHPQQSKMPAFNNGRREMPPINAEERLMVNIKQPIQRQPIRTNFEHKNQPERSSAVTSELFKKLSQMFPEPSQTSQINKVLKNHKSETDLNILSNYCINALFTQ